MNISTERWETFYTSLYGYLVNIPLPQETRPNAISFFLALTGVSCGISLVNLAHCLKCISISIWYSFSQGGAIELQEIDFEYI